MRNIRIPDKYSVLMLVAFSLPILAFFAQAALANGKQKVIKGLTATQGIVGLPEAGLSSVIGSVIGGVLSFVGVIFLVLMIYGGLLWMTAAGNGQNVTKAKDIIISSVIGLIIVTSAYAITAFIGGKLLP